MLVRKLGNFTFTDMENSGRKFRVQVLDVKAHKINYLFWKSYYIWREQTRKRPEDFELFKKYFILVLTIMSEFPKLYLFIPAC